MAYGYIFRYERSPTTPISLEEAMDKFLSFSHVNILYIDLKDEQWLLLTHILDSGTLYVSIIFPYHIYSYCKLLF